MSKKSNSKGFTLIEVVLVLAIGGLIFLLAFIAFRNASVNRRDTQRRSDAGNIVSQLSNYASDRNGSIPSGVTAETACSGAPTSPSFNYFVKTYLCKDGTTFEDPEGNQYTIVTDAPTAKSQIQYVAGTDCNGGGGSKAFSVNVGLEKGVVCRDSGN